MTKDEFRICFDQNFDQIRNYIAYRCGDTELATDICQESFMKIWNKNIDYHPQKTIGLLYKIAKDLWISNYRKLESARKYELSLSFDQGLDDHDPERALELKELKEKYEQTLADMPENQREVFLMSRMDNLTYKEIAKQYDWM